MQSLLRNRKKLQLERLTKRMRNPKMQVKQKIRMRRKKNPWSHNQCTTMKSSKKVRALGNAEITGPTPRMATGRSHHFVSMIQQKSKSKLQMHFPQSIQPIQNTGISQTSERVVRKAKNPQRFF